MKGERTSSALLMNQTSPWAGDTDADIRNIWIRILVGFATPLCTTSSLGFCSGFFQAALEQEVRFCSWCAQEQVLT